MGIAGRGIVLGHLDVETGPVLYAALEDTERRLQSRLRRVLGDNTPPPTGLEFVTELPPGQAALDYLDRWATDHPAARLIVVDVLRKITPPTGASRSSAYEADYALVGKLKRIADDHRVALVAVHHTRKMAAEDGDTFSEVSGSVGITGASDAVLVTKRARTEGTAVLHITGRDVTEEQYALTWVADSCTWHMDDRPAVELDLTDVQARIRRAVADTPGIRPAEVASSTAIPAGTVKSALARMRAAGLVESASGGYRIAA